jgi:hypothetical protein
LRFISSLRNQQNWWTAVNHEDRGRTLDQKTGDGP